VELVVPLLPPLGEPAVPVGANCGCCAHAVLGGGRLLRRAGPYRRQPGRRWVGSL